MKEFVLMNKESGELGAGIRVSFFDDVHEQSEIASLAGYSLQLRNQDFDGWLVQVNEREPWIYARKELIDAKLEVLGEI